MVETLKPITTPKLPGTASENELRARYKELLPLIFRRSEITDPAEWAVIRLEAYWLRARLKIRPLNQILSKVDLFMDRYREKHPEIYKELIAENRLTGFSPVFQIRDNALPREEFKKLRSEQL